MKYGSTELALKANKAHLRRVTLKEITSWTTLTEEKVWSDLNELVAKGRLISSPLMTEDMAMRLIYFDR